MATSNTRREMDRNLLTEEETAEYISMSRGFLRIARCNTADKKRTSGPPFIKIGRAVRYKKSELDKWLDRRTVSTHE